MNDNTRRAQWLEVARHAREMANHVNDNRSLEEAADLMDVLADEIDEAGTTVYSNTYEPLALRMFARRIRGTLWIRHTFPDLAKLSWIYVSPERRKRWRGIVPATFEVSPVRSDRMPFLIRVDRRGRWHARKPG